MIPLRRIAAVTAATAVVLAGGAGAAKKAHDVFWTRPDYARLRVERIALIPVASYDNNIQNENMVEAGLGQAFKPLGYRWISGTTTREMLRARPEGDSLLKALRAGILSN